VQNSIEMAITDALTGLHNAVHGKPSLDAGRATSSRGKPLALMISYRLLNPSTTPTATTPATRAGANSPVPSENDPWHRLAAAMAARSS